MWLSLLLPFAFVLLRPTPMGADSHVWYAEGHRLIARIAESRLTPHTAESVRSILGGQSLASAASWADDIKAQRPQTNSLHFVNIPLDSNSYVAARDCGTGHCIIAELERDRQALTDSSSTDVERSGSLPVPDSSDRETCINRFMSVITVTRSGNQRFVVAPRPRVQPARSLGRRA